jgi:hypothetical protein
MVTAALPDCVPSSWLVETIWNEFGAGAAAGAV